MIYIVLLVFAAGLTFGAGGMNWWSKVLFDHEEAQRIAAEAELAEEQAARLREEANHLIDMQAAFAAGEQSVKGKERIVYQKVREYVTTNPALNNPVCTITDADLLYQLNGAITALRAASNPGGGTDTVSSSGTNTGGSTQGVGPSPAIPGRVDSVPGVRSENPQSGSAAAVPGPSVSKPPKPKPIN